MAEETHVVLTGPIQGLITLSNGREVNVTPDQIVVSGPEEAEEIAFQISKRYYENGHPHDIEEDENGNLVQRPFNYENPPERFADELNHTTQRGTPATPASEEE